MGMIFLTSTAENRSEFLKCIPVYFWNQRLIFDQVKYFRQDNRKMHQSSVFGLYMIHYIHNPALIYEMKGWKINRNVQMMWWCVLSHEMNKN